MSELWSSQQHEWLNALGHTLYVPGSAEPPVPAAAAAREQPVRPQSQLRPPATPASVPAPRPRMPQVEAGTPASMAASPRRAASRLPDKLHFALIRASGCDPGAPGAAAVIARWPSSAELRGNPAAKRALWPQLRALRRPPQ